MQVTAGDTDPADESDDALFARAIAANLLAGDDDALYSDAIEILHQRGTPAIRRRALELLEHPQPSGRSVGAAVLGRIDLVADQPGDPATVDALIELASRESDPVVLQAVVEALGDLRDPRAIPTVLAYAHQATPWLRWSVARSLTWLLAETGAGEVLDEDDPAVQALVGLTADEDSEVRDWATFGVGTQLPIDGPVTRAALWARLEDPDEDARAEALHGLARRHDPRASDLVRAALEAETVGRLAVESALLLADPDLLPALQGLDGWWDVDEPLLAAAIAACTGPPSPEG